MGQFRSYGGFDDVITSDGDVGFVGINQRLLPNQLQPGELRLSRNGRIDGYWQPRKGILLRSGALSSAASPLRLPFWLIDSAGGLAITAASRVDEVVSLTVTGHGLSLVSGAAWLGVEGLGFSSVDPNGVRLVTPVDVDTLEFEILGAAGNETYTIAGSNDVVRSVIDDEAVSEIFGSCHFSDPSSNLEESVILATGLEAKKVTIGDYVVSSLSYPAGVFLSDSVDMIQAFDRVYIFRDGQVAMEWVPGGKVITAAELDTNAAIITVKNHGMLTGDSVDIVDLGFATTDPNGTHTITALTADTFSYPLTGADETYTVASAKMVAAGFTLVAQGVYTQPQVFNIASSAVSVTDGLLTATVVGNTTIQVGNFVSIYRTAIPALQGATGREYEVVSASSTQIEFFVPSGNVTAGGSLLFEFGGRFSVNGGFTHMPAPPWAVYFQRRLWCPLWYSTGGTYGSYTITDLDLRDQICASDILDGDTFDRVYSQYRITAGTADYTVAMQPFYEDRLMILNRNSIHLVSGTQGTLLDSIVTELTSEVGCLARKSVVQYASAIYFLSDSGIYGVEFIDQYNLRGLSEPLSKDIQPFIDRINKSLAGDSVGVYFNNRYWLAVPLDSEPGNGDAEGNNFVLVYNMLNKAWESIDNYGGGNFNIINFHVAQDEERNSLFAVNSFGGLHEIDAREEPIDVFSIDPFGSSLEDGIDYQLVSRGYSFQTSDRKKFSRVQVQLESGTEPSDVVFSFSAEDPDAPTYQIGTTNEAIGEDLPQNEAATLRFRLGNPRGIYGTLTISPNVSGSAPIGRPKINNIVLDASPTNRQTISQY